MKFILQFATCAVLAACLFTSCKNSPAATAETTTATDTLAAVDPKLVGYWVNDAWWKTLQSTKSPRKAAEKLGIAALVINQDSSGWVAVVNYAWHEGGAYQLQPAGEGKYNLVNPEGKTKEHELLIRPDGTAQIDSFSLLHLGDAQMDDTDLMSSIVSGTYSLKGKTDEVIFYSNGSVSGLEGYVGYDVLLDYVVDEIGGDELMLIKPDDERDFYVFQVKGNQLLVSEVLEIQEKDGSTTYKTGKVKYELTKK